jgi:gas vesicle protein
MGSTKRFWKGILLGAIAGGAVALLDNETRKSVFERCKKNAEEISFYIMHPDEAVEQVKEKTQKLRSTVEQVSEDVSFIVEKVEELKEVTTAVVGMVKETKDAF